MYRSSFKIKSLSIGDSLCYGNQLMGECLGKNMIKEANFSKFFSDSSQMMLKRGRNMRSVEILRNFKN